MADLEDALYKILTSITELAYSVDDKVYPSEADVEASAPFIVFSRADGIRDRSLKGSTGLVRARMQVDTYADSYEETKSIASAVRKALDNYRDTVPLDNNETIRIGGTALLNDSDLIDTSTDPKLFRVSMDFLIFYGE